jgi:hypothetical protein
MDFYMKGKFISTLIFVLQSSGTYRYQFKSITKGLGMILGLKRATGAILIVGLATSSLSGCTTVGGASYASQTAMDRAIGQCVASVVIAAGLGALAGAAIDGGRGAGRGAIVGGVVGVGACAVLMQVAAAEDRTRVRNAERDAIAANSTQTTRFSNNSGRNVAVTTSVSSAPIPTPRKAAAASSTPAKAATETKPQFTACRYSQQTVSVEGQSASGGKQLWCRLDTGDWKPIAS